MAVTCIIALVALLHGSLSLRLPWLPVVYITITKPGIYTAVPALKHLLYCVTANQRQVQDYYPRRGTAKAAHSLRPSFSFTEVLGPISICAFAVVFSSILVFKHGQTYSECVRAAHTTTTNLIE